MQLTVTIINSFSVAQLVEFKKSQKYIGFGEWTGQVNGQTYCCDEEDLSYVNGILASEFVENFPTTA